MYAIVEMAGQQFKVAKDQKVFVHRLPGKEGDKVTFDKVLLLDDGKVTIGAPAIEGAAVTAKILSHLKGDKVIVFKKKRRKGYRVKNGHRQAFTEIQIESIAASGHKPAKKAAAKKPVAKKTTTKATAKKEVTKAAPKKAAPKKTAPKKSAKADDLRKVEGIGPKIAGIFTEAGIDTFAKLAKTDVEKLKEILTAAGPRYASKNPNSWPKQAKMAAEGKWDELKEWQDNVKGGIE
jgi:large subunit ribosomal protein L21